MAGSSTVNVKKKCRLGGLGNTSAACNQGDISNLDIKPLDEIVGATTVYRDESALQAMANGDKDVSIISFNNYPPLRDKLMNMVIENEFYGIPVEQTDHDVDTHIVYRNTPRGKANAEKLYDIMATHGGYANDQTPEEAYEIGRLLDYSDESINKYIYDEYISKLPIEPHPDEIDEANEPYTRVEHAGIDLLELKNMLNKKFLGWILPDNMFIEVQTHLDYLVDTYMTDQEFIDDNSIDVDALYDKAFNDGLVRLDYQIVGRKPNLMLQGNKAGRINEIIKTVFISYLTTRESEIYVDIKNNHYKFALPQDNNKLAGFLYGIREEELEEGAGDKYAEKQGVEPEFGEFEKKYRASRNIIDGENVIYTHENGNSIIMNPKSTDSIGYDVRGVIDVEGNFYAERESGMVHNNMLEVLDDLGLINNNIHNWHEVLPLRTGFVTVQRYKSSNVILLGESNIMATPDIERQAAPNYHWKYLPDYDEAIEQFKMFMDKAKVLNPRFNFIPELNYLYEPNMNINENEEIKNNINEAKKMMML